MTTTESTDSTTLLRANALRVHGYSSALSKSERTDLNKTARKLKRLVGEAIADFQMIDKGDRVMVCLSGGKDSYTMLETLLTLQRRSPVDFSIVAVNIDQKHPGYPADVLPHYLEDRGVEYEIIEEDTYSITRSLTPQGKIQCPICSRLRRGILYAAAQRLKVTKIALGHHLDDVVETLFSQHVLWWHVEVYAPSFGFGRWMQPCDTSVVLRPREAD